MDTIYCIIPTRNRRACIVDCVQALLNQTYTDIFIVVIDDGSTDGTSEYLRRVFSSGPRFVLLSGSGALWWAGAMEMGIQYALTHGAHSDYIFFLNDDVEFGERYISILAEYGRANPLSVIGSVQCCSETRQPISYGFYVNYHKLSITSVSKPTDLPFINAFVGRGVLFPIAVVRRIGSLHWRLLPHYISDIEYSARAHEFGFPLVSCAEAMIYSDSVSSDAQIQRAGWFKKWFTFKSKSNAWQRFVFFSLRGQLRMKALLLPRIILVLARKGVHRFSSAARP